VGGRIRGYEDPFMELVAQGHFSVDQAGRRRANWGAGRTCAGREFLALGLTNRGQPRKLALRKSYVPPDEIGINHYVSDDELDRRAAEWLCRVDGGCDAAGV
jgi:hypothetical protein